MARYRIDLPKGSVMSAMVWLICARREKSWVTTIPYVVFFVRIHAGTSVGQYCHPSRQAKCFMPQQPRPEPRVDVPASRLPGPAANAKTSPHARTVGACLIWLATITKCQCADRILRTSRRHQLPILPPSSLVITTVAERGRPPASSGHLENDSGFSASQRSMDMPSGGVGRLGCSPVSPGC